MTHTTCTCIIPFYNEEEGVVSVIKKISNIKYFDEIILVNDGSQDQSLPLVQNFVTQNPQKHIKIISYTKNKGKAHAIKEWLKHVKTNYICTFDSDIKGIQKKEITYMIKNIYNHPEIDMGILRRIEAKRYIKMFYRELILSGQRIVKTEDLKKIFKEKFQKYQLEVAINNFMEKNKKIVVRYPFSGQNTLKSKKRWFFNGLKKDISMFKDIFKYQWVFWYVKHSFSFSPINERKYNQQYNKKQ